MSARDNWQEGWPTRDVPVVHLRPGDRVLVEGEPAVVLDCWHTPRGFDSPGRWLARVAFDDGRKITIEEGVIACRG